MFLDLLSKFFAIVACHTLLPTIARANRDLTPTISTLPFKIHTRSERAFRADCPLDLELIFRRCLLHKVRLEYESSVTFLCCRREPGSYLSLSTEELKITGIYIREVVMPLKSNRDERERYKQAFWPVH